MNKVMGLVNLHHDIDLKGLTTNRSVAAVSFLGRYSIVDFVLSNFSNSYIDEVGILIKEKPKSLFKHIGNSNCWNFNIKSGGISLLYNEKETGKYNHALNNIKENIEYIKESTATDIVIAPDYMINTIDYNDVVQHHRFSNSDVTMVYSMIDNADVNFIGNKFLLLNDDRVIGIKENRGDHQLRKISLNTYVIKKEVLLNMLEHTSSAFFDIEDILIDLCKSINIVGYCYQGYVRCIDSLEKYYHSSLELLDFDVYNELFKENWTIYTKTNDTPPSKYKDNALVSKVFVANGAVVDGVVDNSILGRNVVIESGAMVKDCILFSGSVVGKGNIVEKVIMDKDSRVMCSDSLVGDFDSLLYVKKGDLV